MSDLSTVYMVRWVNRWNMHGGCVGGCVWAARDLAEQWRRRHMSDPGYADCVLVVEAYPINRALPPDSSSSNRAAEEET